MKKFLMLICSVTLIFGLVGTASALPFEFTKTFKKGFLFNKDRTEKTWRFNLDKLTAIDSEDKIKRAKFSIKFGGINGPNDKVDILLDGSSWSDYNNITALVTDDHKLIVKVLRGGGRFKVNSIKLWGRYRNKPSPTPTPEPATILLMGIGLLGLVCYSRKRFSKKS